ncbi:hypothetical protein GOBAR_DD33902 [Gossypium barbadense]|nr:hypothetical protein GOBAR_DD33902 [Gossypium barbadense]
MEVVDDEGVETMIALYCGNGSDKNAPIHLFAELAGMEQNEDVNASDEEHRAQEPWMVAPISYVDSESTMGGIGIDLNITPDIDVVPGEEEGGSNHWDEYVDSDGDPDVDDVPNDIDAEDVNNNGNIDASSVGDQMRRILIHNNLGPQMSLIDPETAYVAEFSEYPEIVHPHGIAVNSDHEELFIGQRFSCKEECCSKAAEGCNWKVQAVFINSSQMWEIRKFVGSHICTSTHMTEDHGKLDLKTICTCIMPMIAKQMAMEQQYGDYDSSYNELQGWIAAMQEYVLGTVIELQTRPYYGPDDQLQPGINAVLLKTHHLPVASVFFATFYKLATLMPRMGQQQVDQIETGHVFVEHVKDAMLANHRLRTLRVWENEFPVLPDLFTWEVPPTTFELIADRGLRRNPRGRL